MVPMLAALAALLMMPASARAVSVDAELVLLVDVSFSIDAEDYALQKRGYVDAFRDPRLFAAIRTGPLGRIAVTYVEWNQSPRQIIGWRLIASQAEAEAFAAEIAAAPRHQGDAHTGVARALAHAGNLFPHNGFEGMRRLIDVSGDGPDNTGRDTRGARDAALADERTTVNAILVRPDPRAHGFYAEDVIGGPRAFLLEAEDFADFGRAILEKLVLEIAGQPLSRS